MPKPLRNHDWDDYDREEYKRKDKKKPKSFKRKRAERESEVEGTDFDDMLAYVDEEGNITSTPPDPEKKKPVKAEEIVVGVPKKGAFGTEEESSRKGKVKFFNHEKGFGFIKDLETQQDIFVHISACKDEIDENDKVTFETEKTPKGLSAINVRKA